MQLVKIERETLLKPLQIVSGIAERRHALPILSNLLLTKNGADISFLSTNLELQIKTFSKFGIGSHQASTTVNARKLTDIIRTIPDSQEIILSLTDSRLTVQSGKSRFVLQTLMSSEFPTIEQVKDFGVSLIVQKKAFRKLLSMVHFAMANHDVRYYLNGMLLAINGDLLIAVATDGHRLALSSIKIDGKFNNQEVIIPRKTILELHRLLEGNEEIIRIDISQTQVKFTFAQIELVAKLVSGKFPDFRRVIPSGYKNTFNICREKLKRSLQRAAILTSDKFKGVRCIITPGHLKIISTNIDQEEAQEELDIIYHGDPIDIGFNVIYLLEMLSNLRVDTVQLSLSDASSSALITVPENDEFKYVVMPMRI
ncbi:MAG: DNA polymerase III subunit beta [Burkholderia sp.]|nr:DNA polymerase III subunit beta [Burkholderia sp.]